MSSFYFDLKTLGSRIPSFSSFQELTSIFKATRIANEAFEKEKPVRLNPFRALTLQKRFNYEK